MLLKNTNQKKQSGMVYGTKGKVTDFHKIGSMPLEKFEDKSIDELFELNNLSHKELEDKFIKIKTVVLEQAKEIERIQGILTKFGLE